MHDVLYPGICRVNKQTIWHAGEIALKFAYIYQQTVNDWILMHANTSELAVLHFKTAARSDFFQLILWKGFVKIIIISAVLSDLSIQQTRVSVFLNRLSEFITWDYFTYS